MSMMDHSGSSMLSADMQQCISTCLNTHRLSMEMIGHCLGMGGAHASPEHIRLLQDNAQITLTSADFMLRNSPLHTRTCAVCAEINEQAAQDSERIGPDAMMQTFIAQCRECAESCRKMAQMMG